MNGRMPGYENKRGTGTGTVALIPEIEFALEKDGFIGALYQPERDEYPGKETSVFPGTYGHNRKF